MGNRLKGRVKSFGPADKDRYGFIGVPGQKDLYFHFNEGRGFVEVDGQVTWSEGRCTRDPKNGDLIYYEVDNHGRPKASPWGFADDADAIQRRINRRTPA